MSENTKVKLRPLEIVAQAIWLYALNFFKFSAIVGLVLLPVMSFTFFVTLVITNNSFDSLDFGYFHPVLFFDLLGLLVNFIDARFVPVLLNITELVFQLLAVTTLVLAVADAYLGQSRGVFETFRGAFKLWGRLLLSLSLVLSVLLPGLAIVMWLLQSVHYLGWFPAGGVGALVIFLTLTLLPFFVPVVVLEKQPLLGGLRRVWDLVYPRFLTISGIVLFALFLVTGAGYLLLIIVEPLTYDIMSVTDSLSLDSLWLSAIAQSLVTLLMRLIFIPLQVTVLVLFYLNLRVSSEGLDLTLSAESNADAWALLAQAPPPNSGSPLSRREWRWVGGLFLVSVVLCILIVLGLYYLTEAWVYW